MRESIVPMPENKLGSSHHDCSPTHRCHEFQPGNPWRVALQQSSPPLPRPYSGSTHNSRPPSKTQRMAYRAFAPCLTQGGHSSDADSENDHGGSSMTAMNYIGLDVHKKTISYCVKDVSGRIQQEAGPGRPPASL